MNVLTSQPLRGFKCHITNAGSLHITAFSWGWRNIKAVTPEAAALIMAEQFHNGEYEGPEHHNIVVRGDDGTVHFFDVGYVVTRVIEKNLGEPPTLVPASVADRWGAYAGTWIEFLKQKLHLGPGGDKTARSEREIGEAEDLKGMFPANCRRKGVG